MEDNYGVYKSTHTGKEVDDAVDLVNDLDINTIKLIDQSLTESQKATARSNISAISKTELNKVKGELEGKMTPSYGSAGSRPTTGLVIGFQYFDTTLLKPIYWTGSKWVDSNGKDA